MVYTISYLNLEGMNSPMPIVATGLV